MQGRFKMEYRLFTIVRYNYKDYNTQLEFWLEEAATVARGMCSEHDFSGALTLAATDRVWFAFPGNVTNLADVIANGDVPQIRARPTWALPNALDPAATASSSVLAVPTPDPYLSSSAYLAQIEALTTRIACQSYTQNGTSVAQHKTQGKRKT